MKTSALILGASAVLTLRAAEVNVTEDLQIEAGTMHVIEVAEGDTHTYSAVISGGGGIRKTGPGTLVLSGDNTFSGGFDLAQGKVRADSGAAFGIGAVTNSAAVSGNHQIIFNADGGIFGNSFALLGKYSAGTGAAPSFYFTKNTTLNGNVTLSKETNFGSDNVSSRDVVFNGEITGDCNIVYKIYGNAHFKSAVDLASLYFGSADSASGTVNLYDAGNSFGNKLILWKGNAKCHAADVVSGSALSMRQELAGTVTTMFDLNGFDQTVTAVTFDKLTSYPTVATKGALIKSAAPATLTITGTGAGKTVTSYYGVSGMVSLKLDADPGFHQVFARRISDTVGSVDIRSGILELQEEASFTNIALLTIHENGAFLVNSTADAALKNLSDMKLDGKFSVGEGSGNPFAAYTLNLDLGDGAELFLPADMELHLASLSTNGIALTGVLDAGLIPQLKSGRIVVESKTSSDTWTGAGASASFMSAENWASGNVPDILGGLSAVFASAEASRLQAEVDRDITLSSVNFTAADGFLFTGEGSVAVIKGVSADSPAEGCNPVYRFDLPLKLPFPQELAFPAGTSLDLSGGSDFSQKVTKSGAGVFGISGSNVWDGAVVVTDGEVRLAGTITTSEGVDGSSPSKITLDDAKAVCLYLSKKSGASDDFNLSVSNAVVEKPFYVRSGEHSSYNYVYFESGTTNIFRGYFHSADAANQKICLRNTDTVVSFEGGGYVPWNLHQTGIGTVYFRKKPFSSAFSNASYFYCVQGSAAGTGTAVFEVAGNDMKWLSIGGDGGTIDMRVDNVLTARGSIKMQGCWLVGGQGSVLKLNGTVQTVASIQANPKYDTHSWIEGDGATLHVTDDQTTLNSLCTVPFRGDVDLTVSTAGGFVMSNAVSSTSGDIRVERGTLRFCPDAAWTNVNAVTVCGNGVLKVESVAGDESRQVFGKEAVVNLEDDGVLDLPSGASVRVKRLFVNGVKMPRGTYGYGCTSDETVRAHFASGSTGVLNVHGEGSFTFTVR